MSDTQETVLTSIPTDRCLCMHLSMIPIHDYMPTYHSYVGEGRIAKGTGTSTHVGGQLVQKLELALENAQEGRINDHLTRMSLDQDVAGVQPRDQRHLQLLRRMVGVLSPHRSQQRARQRLHQPVRPFEAVVQRVKVVDLFGRQSQSGAMLEDESKA